MSEDKKYQLQKVASNLNIKLDRAVEALKGHGFVVDNKPSAKISEEMNTVLEKEFQQAKTVKEEAMSVAIGKNRRPMDVSIEADATKAEAVVKSDSVTKTTTKKKETKVAPVEPKTETKKSETKAEEKYSPVEVENKSEKAGLKILGKIDLATTAPSLKTKSVKPSEKKEDKKNKKRY